MPYQPFDPAAPDAASQSIAQVTTSTRANLTALRDMLVAFGAAPGWSGEPQELDGSAAQDPDAPPQWMYTRGQERIRARYTYGTTGGEADQVTQVELSYSSDGGTTWEPMADASAPQGILTIQYDGQGSVVGYSWS